MFPLFLQEPHVGFTVHFKGEQERIYHVVHDSVDRNIDKTYLPACRNNFSVPPESIAKYKGKKNIVIFEPSVIFNPNIDQAILDNNYVEHNPQSSN